MCKAQVMILDSNVSQKYSQILTEKFQYNLEVILAQDSMCEVRVFVLDLNSGILCLKNLDKNSKHLF